LILTPGTRRVGLLFGAEPCVRKDQPPKTPSCRSKVGQLPDRRRYASRAPRPGRLSGVRQPATRRHCPQDRVQLLQMRGGKTAPPAEISPRSARAKARFLTKLSREAGRLPTAALVKTPPRSAAPPIAAFVYVPPPRLASRDHSFRSASSRAGRRIASCVLFSVVSSVLETGVFHSSVAFPAWAFAGSTFTRQAVLMAASAEGSSSGFAVPR
jgi:hypothetical protein